MLGKNQVEKIHRELAQLSRQGRLGHGTTNRRHDEKASLLAENAISPLPELSISFLQN